jgi:hypothetical protein
LGPDKAPGDECAHADDISGYNDDLRMTHAD